jgi:transposase
MQIRSVGIDLGKTTFHLVARGDKGKVLLKKKFTQKQLINFTANLQTSLIGMEACSGAHFLGRALRAQGHNVKLIPAQFVKPFVKSNKTTLLMLKRSPKLSIAGTCGSFRSRRTTSWTASAASGADRLMVRRTSVINQLRAFLLERGMVFAKSPIRLREAIPEVLENANENLTPRLRNLIAMLWSEWKHMELQIQEMNEEIERIASSDAACCRLRQIPGIGPLVATAIVASIGNGAAFHKGREFAAWMGLVPKQHSTGGKAKLYGISKRGNRYLRKILVHGARAVVLRSKRDRIAMGSWMTSLEMRAPRNVLIVAMANKLARIAWAVLSSGQDYKAIPGAIPA